MIMTELKSWQITSHPKKPTNLQNWAKIALENTSSKQWMENSLFMKIGQNTEEHPWDLFLRGLFSPLSPPRHGWCTADHGSWGSRHGVCCPDPWQRPSKLNGAASKAALEKPSVLQSSDCRPIGVVQGPARSVTGKQHDARAWEEGARPFISP